MKMLAVPWALAFALAVCVVMTGTHRAVAADYSGRALHRHPSLRQFWRDVGDDVDEIIEELEPPWFRHEHLSGPMIGQHRQLLASWGVTPTLTYVSNILGNPVGGRSRKVAYDDNLGLDLHVDLGLFAGLTGLAFHMSGSLRSGRNLSTKAIGNTFPASNLFGGETLRLYALYLEQSFAEETISVQAGRVGLGDEFLTSPLYSIFLNNAIDGNPISVPLNIATFSSTAYPVAQWGLRATVKPTQDWYVMTAVSNGDQTLARNSAHGADLSFRSRASLFAIGEVGYLHEHGGAFAELPGNYKFGGYYDSGKFTDFFRDRHGASYLMSDLPPRNTHNNYGLYVLIDQEVFREDDPKHIQGLTPFAGVTFAPSDINLLPFFFMGGCVYTGLIPGRNRDSLGVGVAYGPFSNDLRRSQRLQRRLDGSHGGVQDFEMVWELTYQYEVTPHLLLQPDLQYLIQPGGTGRIPDALVLGVQIAINL
jgi:porin